MNRDDGAVAVTVAVVLFLLLGMSALVLDLGNAFWERRQLQTGADAAALAAAQEYAGGGSAGEAAGVARQYADVNNRRGAFVEDIDRDGNEVTVITRTGDVASPGVLSSWLAGAIGHDDYFARATAAAAWGAAGTGTTIPIAFCEDSWEHLTGGVPPYASGPPAHTLRVGVPQGHINADIDCSNPGGGDVPPGGFGFLQANADCMAELVAGGYMDGDTGDNPDIGGNRPCGTDDFYAELRRIVDEGQTVLIPIFDWYENQGSKGTYHIAGFGGFVLEGFSINGGPQPSGQGVGRKYPAGMWQGGGAIPCPGSSTCLHGYFTSFQTLGGTVDPNPGNEYGATVISLTR